MKRYLRTAALVALIAPVTLHAQIKDNQVADNITISGGTVDNSDVTLKANQPSTVTGRVTYNATDDRLVVGDGSASDEFYSGPHTTDTNLTEDQVEDFIGGMLGGTQTRVTVTYDDGAGTISFVVDDMNDDVPDSGDFGAASALTAAGVLDDDAINVLTQLSAALCASGQILERQGAAWACITTPTGGGSAHSNGANCSAGNYPLGVDANGAVESCTADVDTDTQLSEEQVEDFVGGMVTGNTETGISVTYDDAGNSLDFEFDIDGLTTATPATGDFFVFADTSDSGIEKKAAVTVSGLTVDEEGTPLSTDATSIDFVGAGVVATNSGGDITVTIGTGGSESTTVSDTATIDMTLSSSDVSGIVILGSLDETHLDTSVNASLDLADSAIQTDTNTQLSEEQVEDFVGGMLGGTETRITVTYDDGGNAINFVVDDMNDDVPESGDFGNAADLDATGAISANAVALGTDTTGNYAGSSSEGGAATTATALAANGANCASGSYPLGVNASGAVEGCTVASGGSVTYVESFIVETATTDDDLRVKASGAITLVQLDCVATGSPAAHIVTVMECSNANASCASSGLTITAAAAATNYNDSTASDATIDDGDWWGLDTTSLTTAADLLHCSVEYTQ